MLNNCYFQKLFSPNNVGLYGMLTIKVYIIIKKHDWNIESQENFKHGICNNSFKMHIKCISSSQILNPII